MHPAERLILWFDQISMEDLPLVGGKNASLGEMIRGLGPLGVRVPDGFAVTSAAYWEFLRTTGLDVRLKEILHGLDPSDLARLEERGQAARHAILGERLPVELEDRIREAYAHLCADSAEPVDVAVRSSATAEDLPEASFAGQQETYLNVRGAGALLEACKRCMASLFTDRAISYRAKHGFGDLSVALSVGVQRMVRSDLASSGVMFSIDTETGFRNAVLINASYGLGESVVQGVVNPDEFYVFKPTLQQGFRPVLQKTLGTKETKLIYDEGGGRRVRYVPVPPADRARFSLSEDEILQLARWACVIEDHYSARQDRRVPMDMEWAKDGISGELFILQARPETVESLRSASELEIYRLKAPGEEIVRGAAIGQRIGRGRARVIRSACDLSQLQDGEVLVTSMTDPDWEPVMRRAAGIVTDRGGRTCHAAIISRELGIPAVVGTVRATTEISTGREVTVCCAEGEAGVVYAGLLDYDVTSIDVGQLPRPRTKVMMNVANPRQAFRLAAIPNDGVGLARLEFIITSSVRVHPMALANFQSIQDAEVKAEIDALTRGYDDKEEFFVDRLAQGAAMIAAAFHPHDVIVRLSDFKTNEYANLLGGRQFEAVEENPMLGFRGASRYYHPRYAAGFALECRAMKKVRDVMGLKNLKLMIPFCRTVEEGRRVIDEMARNGLQRGVDGLEIYVMCEIPSNVILARRFAEIFDGFSIGSNDLTQLILGVDRDSEIIAPLFNERDEAVTTMISEVIRSAHAAGSKIGICGQAPSDYPEFARFLVEQGIDSISLNPDAVIRVTIQLGELEAGASGPGESAAAEV